MKLASFIDNESTSISIESQLERLSLEANILDNVINHFKNLLPNLLSTLSNININLLSDKEEEKIINQLKSDYKSLSPKLEHVNFGTYNKFLVSVPEGFKGNMLDYISLLQKLYADVYIGGNTLLNDYNTILSVFITNKEDKMSLKDHTAFYKKVAKEREEITASMKDYFPIGNSSSKAYLESVVFRFKDLEELVNKVYSFGKDHNKQNMKQFKANVDKSIELLNIIISQSNDGSSKISGNAAKNIAEGAYELGKYVELVSIYRYRSEQAISTSGNIIKTLDEKIK